MNKKLEVVGICPECGAKDGEGYVGCNDSQHDVCWRCGWANPDSPDQNEKKNKRWVDTAPTSYAGYWKLV